MKSTFFRVHQLQQHYPQQQQQPHWQHLHSLWLRYRDDVWSWLPLYPLRPPLCSLVAPRWRIVGVNSRLCFVDIIAPVYL